MLFSYLYSLRVPTKGLMQSHRGLLLPSHGRDVARVARAEMRTKQKTPFAAIFPWKCFFRGDLRLAEAKAGLMRNMAVDAFLYPWQVETEISLAPNSDNSVIPCPRNHKESTPFATPLRRTAATVLFLTTLHPPGALPPTLQGVLVSQYTAQGRISKFRCTWVQEKQFESVMLWVMLHFSLTNF